MSRTINGKLTGHAASTELRDLREIVETENQRKHREFNIRWRWNMRRLKRIDPNWEDWYDNRPEQTVSEMLPLVIERVKQLSINLIPSEEDLGTHVIISGGEVMELPHSSLKECSCGSGNYATINGAYCPACFPETGRQ